MLQQLHAASLLSVRVRELLSAARFSFPEDEAVPHVTVPLSIWAELVHGWTAWQTIQPRGDDWAPPYEPPSEIRVPPDVSGST
jgi:hypothetical protein